MTRPISRPAEPRLGPPSAQPLLRRIAGEPAAALIATIVGPGGAGKTATLDAVAHSYQQAGIEVARHRPRALPDRLDPDRPLLLDDAHRLDGRGLETIRALVESGSVRLVLAHRPWPRPSTLHAVTAGASAHRIIVVVSHLDRAGVAARVAARLGVTAPDSLIELVHEQSGGLPALVDLVAQALCDAGRFDVTRPQEFRRPDRIAVSLALAERMRHPVDALEPTVQALLAALAVGAPLDLEVLRELLEVDPATAPEMLTDAVEAAMATGLVTESGLLIPIVRSLVLRLTPVLRTRELQRRLAVLELDRGGSVLTAGRRLLGTGAAGERVAAVFSAAAAEAMAETPAVAAELLTAAVEAGTAPRTVAGRRAYACALAGDLDRALQLADQVIADPDAPGRVEAVRAAATALSHRGLLASAAELLRFLPAAQHALAVPPLLGTGALADARAAQDTGARADGPHTLVARAATLLAGGMLASVDGSAAAALSQLARAAVLLEPVAPSTLLPDTPAALTAIVAMQGGELSVAEVALRRAITGRHGGRPAQIRHRLLFAWLAMTRGRPNGARTLLAASTVRLEPREELLAAALAIGLARRDHDTTALGAACDRARTALVEHPVDLYSLAQLGECAVGATRLGDPDWLGPHLAEAETLLDALGRPPLWGATLHWYRMHAAVVAEDAAEVARQAAALAELAGAGAQQATLAAAAGSWSALAGGTVDADEVQVAARRLHGAGLVWEAASLAGQAAQRATERRAVLALQACARALAGGSDDTPAEAAAEPEPAAAAVADSGPTTPQVGAAEPEAAPAGSILSDREQEIGSLVLAGLTYKQIGEQLFISAKTVEHHVARMRDRLGVSSRHDLFGRLRALV